MAGDDGTVFVFNKTKQTFLAYRVTVADSMLSRLVGLLGKRNLESDSGLWIIPSQGIHTVGMMFDIDVIFLDRNLRVVGLRELVRPFSMTRLNFQAESVLEMPPHTIFKSRTELGDEFVISSIESALESLGELPNGTSSDETLRKALSTR